MNQPYLEITYRQGKPLAAYLYLDRRTGDKVDHTERHGELLVDVAADGRALGIEFTRVGAVDLAALNRIMTARQLRPLTSADLMPLEAA